jgi:hypothetical protein
MQTLPANTISLNRMTLIRGDETISINTDSHPILDVGGIQNHASRGIAGRVQKTLIGEPVCEASPNAIYRVGNLA